jgi:hypothetical protein
MVGVGFHTDACSEAVRLMFVGDGFGGWTSPVWKPATTFAALASTRPGGQ